MFLDKLLVRINCTSIINKSGVDPKEINICGICCDSRQAEAGSLFVCISGALSDGHDFARAAYDRNCRIFVAEKELVLPDDAIVILTDNTRASLASLSAAFFGDPADKLTVIGITGTKGKTTTSLLIYNILNKNGIPAGYIGSNGVEYGSDHFDTLNTTPESYDIHKHMADMVASGVKVVVMEVSSQALMLDRVFGINFDVCVFTNLYPDHIGKYEHPDFDNYKACKHSLFVEYGASFVVYNADDEHSPEMIAGSNCAAKGIAIHKNTDYTADNIKYFRSAGSIGVSFRCKTDDEEFPVSLSFPGEFSVYNALTSIAVCRKLGLSFEGICRAMTETRIKGRFETIELPNGATVVIDYAHNGVSLKAALTALRVYEPNRLICLFGSVGERTKMRRAELGLVASRDADLCILTSDNPGDESPINIIGDIASYFTADTCPYVAIPDRRKAIEYALENSETGDIILLAGKGHEKYQLIKGERQLFSEAEIIKESLSLCK